MKKYARAFQSSISHQLTYRFNFFIGRLRNIIALLLLYSVWFELSKKTGLFAGYTHEQLTTYVFGMHLIRSVVLGTQSRRVAQEINDGTFSVYLTKPVNHLLFFYFRELGERLLLFFSAIIEIATFGWILDVPFVVQNQWSVLLLFLAALLAAHILYYILSYLVNLIAFWSREALGPRFLFEWFLEFASGAYFPLSIVSRPIFFLLHILPFSWLLFVPMEIYLGRLDLFHSATSVAIQLGWVVVVGVGTWLVWRKGLRAYTGEGI